MKEFTIVRSIFDQRKRSLTVDYDYILFENNDKKDDLFTRINKDEIVGFRYGIHFIKGYRFYIGRDYQIFIQTKNKKELKINFKLFYSRKLNEKHQLFLDIVNTLWDFYFDDISTNYLQLAKNGINFDLAEVSFFKDRIRFNNSEIYFSDLEIRDYKQYYVIYSKKDKNQSKLLYYLQDKNAVILHDVLCRLLKE